MAEMETYAFNADISQLMSLIINAFYSNKEIFLRELISNASDAMDKIQYQAEKHPEKLAVQPDLYIKVTPDREANTITVEDAGIGMTREELVNNLGTIAKSGTKAFMEAVSAGADMTMIGQFGVGFYSAYLVSERVRVVSKSTEDKQYVWESGAGGTFMVWEDEKFEHGVLKRGTKVICYLKDDQTEFLESDRIKDLILKHSAFVGFPIEVYMEQRKEEQPSESDEKVVTVSYKWELINKNKPVWLRQAEEVTHQEYADLYKWLAGDWEDHLAVKHVMQTGQVEFKALLYCPQKAPKDMFDMGKMSQRFSIRLYVRRVFIKEFNDLIPKWMGFIKGIVDSDDMPLNIGRERLQQNAILKHIKTGLQKNVFQMFHEVAKDKSRYKIFYDSFAQCLKLGVYEDHANRQQIIPLLRYYSSKSGEDIVSLDEYIGRMKAGQKHILYISGRTRRDAAKSPYIEGLKKEGYEVLYMFDPVDEYAIQFLKEYQGMELLSCMGGDVLRLLNQSRSHDDLKSEFEPLRKKILRCLGDKVSAVICADDMPAEVVCRLTSGDSQANVLELNLKHGLLKELCKRGSDQANIDKLSELLLELAHVEGYEPEDPRREGTCEHVQAVIQDLGAGDQDFCADDIPTFHTDAFEVSADWDFGKSTVSKEQTLLSCGKMVRVTRGEQAKRAIITFVDDDVGTVDVLYPAWGSISEKEEEGVPVKAVSALQNFESDAGSEAGVLQKLQENLYKTASGIKDQGNQLFKLKDFQAAHEQYTLIIKGFRNLPRAHGATVLAYTKDLTKPDLVKAGVTSVDADKVCELSNGLEIPANETLPVVNELLPLQTAAHMNRARCRQSLGLYREAAQDLTTVLHLWSAADARMLEADQEMKEAESKGLYTAEYLRGRSRLARGLLKLAAADVRAALARNPPAAMVKQLKELKAEVGAAQEEYRRVHSPLVKELARVLIGIRGGPKIS